MSKKTSSSYYIVLNSKNLKKIEKYLRKLNNE